MPKLPHKQGCLCDDCVIDRQANRIEVLEAQNKRLTSRGFEDLHFENETLKAKLDAVSKLPDKWHEIIRNLSDSQRLCMHPINECANDLKEALQEQEDKWKCTHHRNFTVDLYDGRDLHCPDCDNERRKQGAGR